MEDVPAPACGASRVLVRVDYSCVSAGTEVARVEVSGMPLYRRALKQREQAKRVLDVARTEGFAKTYRRVRGMLDAGLPAGYSAAGTVVAVGEEVDGFVVGDRVACAGGGIANHAELIDVPVNLAVRVPDDVSLADAATVTLGAIALQGVRRASPTLGETVGVIGLGIVGQLTVQLLRAAGCRVVGSDVDAARVRHALRMGMQHGVVPPDDDFPARAHAATDGFGADAVIVTAATSSSDVLQSAFQACRKKGRVVLVGDTGLELRREDLYEKELDFLISTSYGPGRYDPVYEEEGQDYPIGYVRWTENRNMEEYLRLLADGSVALGALSRETYPIDAAGEAYERLRGDGEKPLVVLISYPTREEALARTTPLRRVAPRRGRVQVALVGAGSFAQGTLVPALLKLEASFQLRCVMSRTGASAVAAAKRAEAAYATTDLDAVLADDEVDLILVATRHHLHAPLVLRALEAGKHVFVEKPLALTEDELEAIERFYSDREGPLLMTGFNRRFSPAARRLRELLEGRQTPLVASYRMNAGYLPPDHWVHGPDGGGRNIGEACHVYDLFDHLVGGAEVERVDASGIRPPSRAWAANDNFVATVRYSDGSVCSLAYTALGDRSHPKERLDVFADARVLVLDDYRSLSVAGTRRRGWRGATQQKGHREELEALAAALREGGPWPIPLEEQLRATRISFDVEARLAGGGETG